MKEKQDEKQFKLNFELIPDSCWYSNLRTILQPKMWDIVRRDAYERANGKCMICGKPCRRLEAHERWSYDEKKGVQKLEDVVAVCHNCHSVIHIGRTQLVGNDNRAITHFCRINGCKYMDYVHALGEANRIHQRRNKVKDWKLDLSWLNRFIPKPDGHTADEKPKKETTEKTEE